MKYKIIEDKVYIFFTVKDKEYRLMLSIINNMGENYVVYNPDYVGISSSLTNQMVTPAQKLFSFFDDLNFITADLNNMPDLNEKFLEYSMNSICTFHIMKYGRLIDSDLAGYASTIMCITNCVLEEVQINKTEFRYRLIKMMLDKHSSNIYIFTSQNGLLPTPQLQKYTVDMNDLGFQLGI